MENFSFYVKEKACNAYRHLKIISTCSVKEWVNFPPLHETLTWGWGGAIKSKLIILKPLSIYIPTENNSLELSM